MCIGICAIAVQRGTRKLYFKSGINSHNKIRENFKLSDTKFGEQVNLEAHPRGKNFLNSKNWKVVVDHDQENLPEWFLENRPEVEGLFLDFLEEELKKIKRTKKYKGSLSLSGCTGLTGLPQGLVVKGDLWLQGCTGLTSLPQGLVVEGSLILTGCTGLTSLPQGLVVEGNLDLTGCTGLTSLPQDLVVEGDLYLYGCTGLTSLPQGLVVKGDLWLQGCTGLTSLPQGLVVKGNLYLNSCTGLTSFPQGLVVEGSLYLNGCTGLSSISGKIKGAIYLDVQLFEKCSTQNLLNYKDHFEKNFRDLLENKVVQEKIKNVKKKNRFQILKGI